MQPARRAEEKTDNQLGPPTMQPARRAEEKTDNQLGPPTMHAAEIRQRLIHIECE
jgi:hypothetical protein